MNATYGISTAQSAKGTTAVIGGRSIDQHRLQDDVESGRVDLLSSTPVFFLLCFALRQPPFYVMNGLVLLISSSHLLLRVHPCFLFGGFQMALCYIVSTADIFLVR